MLINIPILPNFPPLPLSCPQAPALAGGTGVPPVLDNFLEWHKLTFYKEILYFPPAPSKHRDFSAPILLPQTDGVKLPQFAAPVCSMGTVILGLDPGIQSP